MTMYPYMLRVVPSILCTAIAQGCEREPTLGEELASLQVASDAAFLAFKQGDYSIFREKMFDAQAVSVRLFIGSHLPTMSLGTMKSGTCDAGAIDGYYEALKTLLQPALPLLSSSGSMTLSEELETADFLANLRKAADFGREPLSVEPNPQHLDYDRISPGLSDSLDKVNITSKSRLLIGALLTERRQARVPMALRTPRRNLMQSASAWRTRTTGPGFPMMSDGTIRSETLRLLIV